MYNTVSAVDISHAPEAPPPNPLPPRIVVPVSKSSLDIDVDVKRSNIKLVPDMSWMKRDPYMLYIGLAITALAVVSMVLAIISYILLNGAVNDVSSVIDNWTSVPIYNVTVLEYTESCPAGYSSVYSTDLFKGNEKGSCACETNIYGYTSTYSNCSDTIESTFACASDPSVNDVNLKLWRGKKLCYIREGQAPYEFDTKKQESYHYTGDAAKTPWRRPRPDSSGTCISGYQLCGATGSYSDTKSFCYPSEYQCPLSGLKVASTANAAATIAAGYTEYMGALDDGYVLYGRRGYSDELPIIYVDQALAEVSGTGYDLLTYSSVDNDRGFCYPGKGSRQKLPNYLSYSEDAEANSNNFLPVWSYDLPSRCLHYDRRWNIIDNNNMESHFVRNFQYLVSDCEDNRGSMDFYGLDDSNWVSSDDPDVYYGTSVSSAYTQVWEYYNYFSSAPTCTSGDSICTDVYNQTVCGKYVDLAHQFNSDWDDVTYALYNQNEIYWSESCTTEDVIYSNLYELKQVRAAQIAVVITGAILGAGSVIMKWIDYTVQKSINDGRGKDVCCGPGCVDNRKWIENLFLVCKMIPIFASFIITAASYKVWVSVGSSSDCSDTTTNYTFNYLAEKLPEIYYNTAATFAMDVVLLAVGVVSAWKGR